MKTYKWLFLILVAGILISCKKTSEEELVGDWQKRAVFAGFGRAFTANFVIGNKGYVVGGATSSRVPLKEVYVFDHVGGGGTDMRGNSLGTWDQLLDFPGDRRQQAVGFSLNGYGYMGTGWSVDAAGDGITLSDFWRFDPNLDAKVVNAWEPIADFPGRSRQGAIAFVLNENGTDYGYVGCGFHIDDEGRNIYLNDFWRYDPLNNKWAQVSGYGGNKRNGAASFVIDNKAYICSGENADGTISDFWMFNPNAGEGSKWTRLRDMYDSNPDEDYDDDYRQLPRAFGVAYTATLKNGELRGHIVGGQPNGNINW